MNEQVHPDVIKVVPNYGYDRLDLVILSVSGNGVTHCAAPIEMRPHKHGEPIERCAGMTSDTARLLMDSLWQQGIRPSVGVSSAGRDEAIRCHLDDMRKIASAALTKGGIEVNL